MKRLCSGSFNIVSAALALVAGSAACADPGPPVEPAMEIGFLERGEFVPLGTGGACYVVVPPQGGFWSMPTIRVWGIEETAMLGCSLYDNDQAMELGRVSPQPVMYKSRDGGDWVEAAPFLLPLREVNSQDEFNALDGHSGTLSCTAIGDEIELSRDVDVLISAVTGF